MRRLNQKEKAFFQYGFLLLLISMTTYLVSTTLDTKLLPKIIKIIDVKYVLLGMFLIILYIVFEGIIIRIIINSIENTKIKFIGFKIATMGMYYNLVTPFASGGQPMQIYALTKYDISLSKAVAIISNKTILFQSIVTIYCAILLIMNIQFVKSEMPSIVILITIGMIMNITMLLSALLVLFVPNILKKILNKLIKILSKFKFFKSINKKIGFVDNLIDEYNYSIKVFIKDKKNVFNCIILNIIQLTVFFSLAYCVYKAFNLEGVSYLKLLICQVFLYMSVSPIPTPGNIGANELVFLKIFGGIIPQKLIGYSVFLYVGFVYYFIVIISGITTITTHYKLSELKKYKMKI